jgi:arabinofuranosyltransferase
MESVGQLSVENWPRALCFSSVLMFGVALTGTSNRSREPYVKVLMSVGIVFVICRSITMAHLVDESMIDFRYASNLATGQGVVFNPGERVNGYGSLLWVILLAVSGSLGSVASFATIATLASLVAVLSITWKCSRLMRHGGESSEFSIALVLLSVSCLIASYGTSGLATMPAALFALLCFYWSVTRPEYSGACAALATLCEPLCIVFCLTLAVGKLLRRDTRQFARFTLAMLLLLLPAFLWSKSYYGDPLSLVFYSRGYAEPHFEQGLVYLSVAILGQGLWALLPAVVVGLFDVATTANGRVYVISGFAYLLGVVWIGGDKFDGRLLIVLLPGFFLAAERGMRLVWLKRHYLLTVTLAVVAGAIVFPQTLLGKTFKRWEIADPVRYDRHQVSGLVTTKRCESFAEDIKSAFGDSGIRITLASTCAGTIAYRTQLPVVDLSGEVDQHLARHFLPGAQGSYKDISAHAAYLSSRGVDMSEVPIWPDRYSELSTIGFGTTTLHLGRYRQEVIDRIAQSREARMPPVLRYLDAYPPDTEPSLKECDRWFLEKFYFKYAHSAARMSHLNRLSLTPNVKSFYEMGDDANPQGWVMSGRLELESSRNRPWLRVGPAFGEWPTSGYIANQHDLSSVPELTINSFHPKLHNQAKGRLQSAEFEIIGDVITLQIGGGRDADTLFVALLIDGNIVLKATGCESEMLRRQVWDVAQIRGRRARILLVDDNSQNWGHLVVGDIKQWRHRATSLGRLP